MSNNERIILDEVLKQRQAEIDPAASPAEFFELFTAEQILKDYDLSYDEVEGGLVADGGDGGIDGFYIFVNGELVQEEPDYSSLKKNVTIEVVLIQAKTSSGFQETPVERFITVSDDVFDLSKNPDSLRTTYNSGVVEGITRFRETYQQLAGRFPVLHVSYFYATKGTKPEPATIRKVEKLQATVRRHFPEAAFEFHPLGASELLTLARKVPRTTYSLSLAENPIASAGQVGFVCLVRLVDFFKFIADESGNLRRHIFEANVRDYQGRTEVNDEIQRSLQDGGPEDFWWLNNGITILASKASQSGKTLTIEDPQIVNGLQTSTEVYNYCTKYNTEGDERKLLIRIIVPSEVPSRDRIIKATNSQTALQRASLRATDRIHRDIEEFLRPRGLFYDRRKNHYKNEGKPRDRIVSIAHLAQAVMAILLHRPDTARARPSSLLKRDEDYERIYGASYPIALYYVCAALMRKVEEFLKSPAVALPPKERNNLRFYVAMVLASNATGKERPSPQELAGLDPTKITEADLTAALSRVRTRYDQLGADDQVAKGPALLEVLREGMKSEVSPAN